jgi:glutathione S-transferase
MRAILRGVKLYFFPVAPNPTKVRLYIEEKRAAGGRLDVVPEVVDLRSGEQKTPAHLARNPLGRLPVLELDDGSHLTESLPIIEYLEDACPEPPMIGRSPRERARVRELERIADLGVLVPCARIVHATKSPLGLPASPEVAALFRRILPEACKLLDERLSDGRPFLAGERATIADCTLAAALQFARFGGVEIDAGLEHLLRWDAAYRGRAPARAVLVL